MRPRRVRLIHSGAIIVKTRTSNKKTDYVCANHNTNVFEYYTHSFIHNKGFSKMKGMKHRAVSDIIATLLLLGITVAGAVLVAAFFQGNSVFRPDATSPGTQTASIKIIGYDTRDSSDLSGIDFLDNFLDAPPFLCTITCNASPDDLPSATSGTEFIVLTVRNQGMSKVSLQSVEVNGIDHSWDASTSSNVLSAASYPAAGKFSIISTSNTAPITQSSTNEMQSNGEARLVIKLSDDISQDIDVNQPIRTRIITNLLDPSATIITSGSVR